MNEQAVAVYEKRGQGFLEQARDLMIVDDVTRGIASEATTELRKVIKAIEAEFRPDVEKAHELHKNLLDRMKRLQEPFRQAQAIIDREIRRDFLEQEEARRKAEQEAREKAEKERKEQEAAQLREAESRIADGDVDKAEEILSSEIRTMPIMPVAEPQRTVKTAGGTTTVRKDISVQVADKAEVVKAVAKGELPMTLVEVNVAEAKRYAKAAGLMAMPGFVVSEDAIVSGRTR